LLRVWQIFRTRDDAHFITPRFSARTTVSRRSRTLRIHDGVQRQASRRDACSSRPWGAKGFLQKHTACDQAMIIRPTSVPGRTRFSFSPPRSHLRPDEVGRERPPVGAGPGPPPGVAARVAHAPHHPISRPRGFRGGEARRLVKRQQPSGTDCWPLSYDSAPRLALFAEGRAPARPVHWTGGNTAPRSVFPLLRLVSALFARPSGTTWIGSPGNERPPRCRTRVRVLRARQARSRKGSRLLK
jgi:hypothetical protein